MDAWSFSQHGQIGFLVYSLKITCRGERKFNSLSVFLSTLHYDFLKIHENLYSC
jgi:hypothetical protein